MDDEEEAHHRVGVPEPQGEVMWSRRGWKKKVELRKGPQSLEGGERAERPLGKGDQERGPLHELPAEHRPAAGLRLTRLARGARGVAGEVCRIEERPEMEVCLQEMMEEEAAVLFDAGRWHADVQGDPEPPGGGCF